MAERTSAIQEATRFRQAQLDQLRAARMEREAAVAAAEDAAATEAEAGGVDQVDDVAISRDSSSDEQAAE